MVGVEQLGLFKGDRHGRAWEEGRKRGRRERGRKERKEGERDDTGEDWRGRESELRNS